MLYCYIVLGVVFRTMKSQVKPKAKVMMLTHVLDSELILLSTSIEDIWANERTATAIAIVTGMVTATRTAAARAAATATAIATAAILFRLELAFGGELAPLRSKICSFVVD